MIWQVKIKTKILIFSVFQDVCKWSAQNLGKTPDPWYKLKFRPKEVKVKIKKEVIKKEKPPKELTKKQKEKLEKVSIFWNTLNSSL